MGLKDLLLVALKSESGITAVWVANDVRSKLLV